MSRIGGVSKGQVAREFTHTIHRISGSNRFKQYLVFGLLFGFVGRCMDYRVYPSPRAITTPQPPSPNPPRTRGSRPYPKQEITDFYVDLDNEDLQAMPQTIAMLFIKDHNRMKLVAKTPYDTSNSICFCRAPTLRAGLRHPHGDYSESTET